MEPTDIEMIADAAYIFGCVSIIVAPSVSGCSSIDSSVRAGSVGVGDSLTILIASSVDKFRESSNAFNVIAFLR